MNMMRSMFAGVSGLRSHQTMMDVVGNNIANVNTAGFKSAQITFGEAMAQTLQGPAGAGVNSGGTNPLQIGLGVQVASIDGVFTQGAIQITGRPTDIAIQGDGFFILEDRGGREFTRAGTFRWDESGNLVAPGGQLVQGWLADAAGEIQTQTAVQGINLPLSQVIEPVETSLVHVGGNLSSDAAIGDIHTTSIVVYDSLGEPQELLVDFEKTAANTWDVSASMNGTSLTLGSTSVTFDSDGQLTSAGTISVSGYTPPGASPLALDLQLATNSPLVQFGGVSSAESVDQNGNAIGFLTDFSIASNGTISGQFSNGETKVLAMIATATFNNPSGLIRSGETRFESSVNSGQALIGEPGNGNRGLLASGALEMSNVDLAQEFTNLIIAQRGFQANSRVITASDEVLADLVNLKR
jgi:flagellar hook protein FlgE